MPEPLSRRTFLAAGAGALALAACSGGSKATSGSTASGSNQSTTYNLAQIYATEALVPGAPQRLAYALLDGQGAIVDNPPGSIDFAFADSSGKAVGSSSAPFHRDGLPRGYYPVTFTPPAAGAYTVSARVNGSPVVDNLQIPATSQVLQPGQKMIPFDTPTAANPQGVELLCTHTPACPL